MSYPVVENSRKCPALPISNGMKISTKYLYWIVAVLLIANTLVFFAIERDRPSNILKVAFLDVGQGDAIFIQTPSGNQILLDGGPGKQVLRSISQMMPFYDSSLDLVINSHPDFDHIDGLNDILARYDVAGVIEPAKTAPKANDYKQFASVIALKKEKVWPGLAGTRLDLGGGATLEILYPQSTSSIEYFDTNDSSLVIKLIYKNKSFLLAGDISSRAENILAQTIPDQLKASVFKATHHGSKYSNTLDFLEKVQPEAVAISVGAKNTYGHPSPEALSNFAKIGAPVYRTDQCGTIVFETDGEQLGNYCIK